MFKYDKLIETLVETSAAFMHPKILASDTRSTSPESNLENFSSFSFVSGQNARNFKRNYSSNARYLGCWIN